MNETVTFTFVRAGKQFPINRLLPVQDDRGGLIFQDETSAWPRGLRFTLQGVGQARDALDRLRRDTANGDHRFEVKLGTDETLSFTTLAPDTIPPGIYEYSLRIADLRIKNSVGHVRFTNDQNHAVVEIEVEPEDRQVAIQGTLLTDAAFKPLLDSRSIVDGRALRDWLTNPDCLARPKRKACLLNILAMLSVSPSPAAPLLPLVKQIFFCDVDRIYVEAEPSLPDVLRDLDLDPAAPFSLDRGVLHPTHQKLLRRIPERDQDLTETHYRPSMRSYRQDAQPSMQIVVVSASVAGRTPGCYGDIDIDLGKPTRDLSGFFVHLGELIAEGQTDHLKMHKKLKGNPALKPHLHYTVEKV